MMIWDGLLYLIDTIPGGHSMKKIKILLPIILLFLFCLSACGNPKEQEEKAQGELPVFDLEIGQWKDNSLDCYSALSNTFLETAADKEALGGGKKYFFSGENAVYFRKYVYQSASKGWDRIIRVNRSGEVQERTIEYGASGVWNDQVWQVGERAGNSGYVLEKIRAKDEGSGYEAFFWVTDENLNPEQQVKVEWLCGDNIRMASQLLQDAEGKFHAIYEENGESFYLVFSPEGELLLERSMGEQHLIKLLSLDTGEVGIAIDLTEAQSKGIAIVQYAVPDGQEKMVCSYDIETEAFYLLDAEHLVYATAEGVVLYSIQDKQEKMLYTWKNHGIRPGEVIGIHGCGQELIQVIYCNEKGPYYLALSPTTEEVEIENITFAVSPVNEKRYEKAVAEFNIKYPRYHIDMKSDYDVTALRTQLMAGSGPVLIDSTLTGFENCMDFWQPLNGIYEKLGLSETMVPKAMELGMVGDGLYGICTCFYLSAFMTLDRDENWDYDRFIESLEENAGITAISPLGYDEGDAWSILMNYFYHSPADNYFLDEKQGLKKEHLEKALEIAEKYGAKANREDFAAGRTLGSALLLERPEQLALYYLVYGEKACYSGFPTDHGGVNYITGNMPLVMNVNATDREKGIGAAFLAQLLSADSQWEMVENTTLPFSVRQDILDEQIKVVNVNTLVWAPGFETQKLGKFVPQNVIRETLNELLNQSEVKPNGDRELITIMSQEFEQYFGGVITKKMLLDNLENRIKLYLNE